jgi:hypothetical protein
MGQFREGGEHRDCPCKIGIKDHLEIYPCGQAREQGAELVVYDRPVYREIMVTKCLVAPVRLVTRCIYDIGAVARGVNLSARSKTEKMRRDAIFVR